MSRSSSLPSGSVNTATAAKSRKPENWMSFIWRAVTNISFVRRRRGARTCGPRGGSSSGRRGCFRRAADCRTNGRQWRRRSKSRPDRRLARERHLGGQIESRRPRSTSSRRLAITKHISTGFPWSARASSEFWVVSRARLRSRDPLKCAIPGCWKPSSWPPPVGGKLGRTPSSSLARETAPSRSGDRVRHLQREKRTKASGRNGNPTGARMAARGGSVGRRTLRSAAADRRRRLRGRCGPAGCLRRWPGCSRSGLGRPALRRPPGGLPAWRAPGRGGRARW